MSPGISNASNDSNDVAAIGEPDSKDALRYPTETVITLLSLTVPGVTRYDAARIEKRQLRLTE